MNDLLNLSTTQLERAIEKRRVALRAVAQSIATIVRLENELAELRAAHRHATQRLDR